MKNTSTRTLVILSLIVAILGLSMGFAAYSQTLTIKSSAEVKPNSDIFNVDFSLNSDSVVPGNVVPTLNPSNVSGFTATNAVIDNTDSGNAIIKNLHAVFTAPGQSATYSFYTKNAGELKAYLKSVTFNNITGDNVTKKCTPKSGGTSSEVTAMCSNIALKVIVGSETFTSSKSRNEFSSPAGHDLNKNGSEEVKVMIVFDENAEQPTESFNVAFGDVVLLYSSNE